MSTKPETKPWYLSLTIWAALATVVQGTIYEMTQVLDPFLPAWLKAVLMATTTGLAVFGRVRATMGIGKAKPPVTDEPDDSGHVRLPLLAGSALLAVVLYTLAGCSLFTAAERDQWKDFGKGTGATVGKVATQESCRALALMCAQKGGAVCSALASLYCTVGVPALDGVLTKWASGTSKPTPVDVQAHMTVAFATHPELIMYRAQVIQMDNVQPAKQPTGFIQPGTRTPTTAEGGVKIEDSAPVQ